VLSLLEQWAMAAGPYMCKKAQCNRPTPGTASGINDSCSLDNLLYVIHYFLRWWLRS
jgi:hypothetical protein